MIWSEKQEGPHDERASERENKLAAGPAIDACPRARILAKSGCGVRVQAVGALVHSAFPKKKARVNDFTAVPRASEARRRFQELYR